VDESKNPAKHLCGRPVVLVDGLHEPAVDPFVDHKIRDALAEPRVFGLHPFAPFFDSASPSLPVPPLRPFFPGGLPVRGSPPGTDAPGSSASRAARGPGGSSTSRAPHRDRRALLLEINHGRPETVLHSGSIHQFGLILLLGLTLLLCAAGARSTTRPPSEASPHREDPGPAPAALTWPYLPAAARSSRCSRPPAVRSSPTPEPRPWSCRKARPDFDQRRAKRRRSRDSTTLVRTNPRSLAKAIAAASSET